ncbi:hypothetical protein X474_03650 [Dethiosulfatarculus sandiegensis]|uniref:Uncharacterized protein n=1 Tax=Dethiosulfatarculus sandiegensis TaxID=1429043 RepID=A0A0D2GL19_9BACT|nr:hypothetical protein X474_03650 [Dethiosulfatarculus sandiegensis]
MKKTCPGHPVLSVFGFNTLLYLKKGCDHTLLSYMPFEL